MQPGDAAVPGFVELAEADGKVGPAHDGSAEISAENVVLDVFLALVDDDRVVAIQQIGEGRIDGRHR